MWLKRRDTAQRYGVAVRTIERWEDDPKLKFPKSRIVNGRRYDNALALDDWDTQCAAAGRCALTPPAAGVGRTRQSDGRADKVIK
jgi:hypothetical protein